MKNNPPPLGIRKLILKGFLGTLADRTGCTSTPDISQIVLRERTQSKYWPAILKLAKETSLTGFATWTASNSDKIPAVAQAA